MSSAASGPTTMTPGRAARNRPVSDRRSADNVRFTYTRRICAVARPSRLIFCQPHPLVEGGTATPGSAPPYHAHHKSAAYTRPESYAAARTPCITATARRFRRPRIRARRAAAQRHVRRNLGKTDCTPQRVDVVGFEFLKFSGAERARQRHRSETHPHQTAHRDALRFPHAAHFAVAAFAQHHVVPVVHALAARVGDGVETGGAVVEHHALAETLQYLVVHLAQHAHRIFAFDLAGRVHQPIGELAVVAEQQQAQRIEVEPADRDPAAADARQPVEYRGAAFGIGLGADLARGLVINQHPRPRFIQRRRRGDLAAVDTHHVAVGAAHAELGRRAVDGDAAGAYPVFEPAARAQAGARQPFLQTFAHGLLNQYSMYGGGGGGIRRRGGWNVGRGLVIVRGCGRSADLRRFRALFVRRGCDGRQQDVDLGGDGFQTADLRKRRQLAQAFQIEIVNEIAGGAVQRRLARHFAVTDHAYPFALVQRLDDVGADADTADVFDLGAADGLAIGNQHQRLQPRARVARRLFFPAPRNPLRIVLLHLKAETAVHFFQLDAARRAILAQGLQGLLDDLRLGPRLLRKYLQQLLHVHGLAGGEERGFKNILQLLRVHRHDSGLSDKSGHRLRSGRSRSRIP